MFGQLNNTKERRQCRGKRRFFSEGGALVGAKGIEKKTGQKMNVYHCPYCDGYHVGHKWSDQEEAFWKKSKIYKSACWQIKNGYFGINRAPLSYRILVACRQMGADC